MRVSISKMLVQIPQEFSRSSQGRIAEPAGIWDHIIVSISVAAVLAALYLCIRFFLLPGEKDRRHIKHRILGDDISTGPGDEDE